LDVVLVFKADYIVVNAVMLGESLAGFRCGTREEQNRMELDMMITLTASAVFYWRTGYKRRKKQWQP
jgi:hypothetical protein